MVYELHYNQTMMTTRKELLARLADLSDECMSLAVVGIDQGPAWDELHRALAELHAIQALEVRR